MTKFHIIYTLNGKVHDIFREFSSVKEAENWLKKIGATYWLIGAWDELESGMNSAQFYEAV